MSFGNIHELVERGLQLQTDVLASAQTMSAASRAAIEAVNPSLAGTEIGEEWPLTFDLSVERRFTELVTPTLQSVGRVALETESPFPHRPRLFMQYKFKVHMLEEAYKEDDPRTALAKDVVAWTDKMHKAGWSLLSRLILTSDSRVDLDIYEDNNIAKNYFDFLTDIDSVPKEEQDEGAGPYIRLSDRVIVDDLGVAASVLGNTK